MIDIQNLTREDVINLSDEELGIAFGIHHSFDAHIGITPSDQRWSDVEKREHADRVAAFVRRVRELFPEGNCIGELLQKAW